MAQDGVRYNLNPDEWTLVMNGDAANLTFMVNSGAVMVAGLPSATLPSNSDYDYKRWSTGEGEKNAALADLFPGATTPVRAAMRSIGAEAQVVIDHA